MDYDAKMSGIKGKYVTTSDYNKITSDKLDAKIKQKELVNKSDISSHVKKFWIKHKTCTISKKSRIKSRAR